MDPHRRAARRRTRRPERHRGDSLPEVLLALALLGLAMAGCAQVLLQALSAQAQAGLRERAAWLLADGGELIQAWPDGPPAAQVTDWQAAASALVADDPARTASAVLQPGAGNPPPARRWRATVSWGVGDEAAATATFIGSRPVPVPP